jgi:hypothetical protein
MMLHPALLAAALLFWGWHTGLWWLGAALAVLVVLPQGLGWQWQWGLKERQRTADLCTLLVALSGLYLYFTEPRLGSALIRLLQWSPALLFPLLAVQLYGGRAGVEMSVLFLSLRGDRPGGAELVDLRPAYWLLCLLAAAMVPPASDAGYYPLLAGLLMAALWPLLAPPARRAHWLAVIALAVSLGYALSLGLQRAHSVVEDAVVDWLVDWFGHETDPYKTTTAIGDIGDLKMSEQIVLRVRPEGGAVLHSALLLRSASYNRYFRGTWLAPNTPFSALALDQRGWLLVDGKPASERYVGISLSLSEHRGMLPLPGGSRTLRGLEGAELSRNAFGAVKVTGAPALAQYQIDYGSALSLAAPESVDLRLPSEEAAVLQRLAAAWGLAGLPAQQALQRLRGHFLQHFSYSLRLQAPPRKQSALAHFLLETHRGHCEYFASAATLLLRAAGIPARYALGWSVQEYSDIEQAYVARERHAHAWSLVWIDGAWHDFDPTPPDWAALEAEQRPFWGYLLDRWSRLRFLLAGGEGRRKADNRYLGGALLTLVLLLGWRIARRGQRQRPRQSRRAATVSPSAFAAVEAEFTRQGLGRHAAESLLEWVYRLERQQTAAAVPLRRAIALHYRLCFDTLPLSETQRQRLQAERQQWLERCLATH